MRLEDARIAVIGLGYVGLPLAVEFGKQRPSSSGSTSTRSGCRRAQRRARPPRGQDQLAGADLTLSADESVLDDANVYIVTTPTPIDQHKQPDLRPVLSASETIGRHLSRATW